MALPPFIKNRKFSYEVYFQQEGRWTLDSLLAEEEEASAYARGLLKAEGVTAIKVLRYRETPSGFTTKKEILYEDAPRTGPKPISLSAAPAETFFCEQVDDLYRLENRMAVIRLFRQFLIKHAITPTELMHNWSYVRKLNDTGRLIGSAVYRVATDQAQKMGAAPKERTNALEKLVDQAIGRVRDMAAERKRLPRPDAGDLAYISRRIQAKYEPHEHDFAFLTVLSQDLFGTPSIAQKMDKILKLLDEGVQPHLEPLLEGYVADSLGFTDIIEEFFGYHVNLCSFLCMLADLLNGRLNLEQEGLHPSLRQIAGMMAEGRAPSCQQVLLDWLVRELDSRKPLDKKEPDAEEKLLKKIAPHLEGEDGTLLGGDKTAAALADRKKIARQRSLHKLGILEA